MRDAWTDLKKAQINVYAVSLDDVKAIKQFQEKESFPFPLLSDTDASVTKRFGVLHESGRYSDRITIIVNAEGVIQRVEKPNALDAHGRDLLDWGSPK